MSPQLREADWGLKRRFVGGESIRARSTLDIDHQRQQMPYRCQSRNHGLCACISSCLRFAAETSLGLSGLVSGTAMMRSSHSISAMVCSASICHNI
jgi:hypothetical protein